MDDRTARFLTRYKYAMSLKPEDRVYPSSSELENLPKQWYLVTDVVKIRAEDTVEVILVYKKTTGETGFFSSKINPRSIWKYIPV